MFVGCLCVKATDLDQLPSAPHLANEQDSEPFFWHSSLPYKWSSLKQGDWAVTQDVTLRRNPSPPPVSTLRVSLTAELLESWTRYKSSCSVLLGPFSARVLSCPSRSWAVGQVIHGHGRKSNKKPFLSPGFVHGQFIRCSHSW